MTQKIGVIGCGNISRFHFAGLAKAGASLAWACDVDPALARQRAECHGARWTSDYRDVINDPDVTVVDVTATAPVHLPVCLAAIKAGKAVICEKTLATSADDAWRIVQAAEERGTILYTSYMKRFMPAVEKAKELLPRIGRILTTHLRSHQCWGDLWTANPAAGHGHTPANGRSGLVDKYGGGVLVCGGSHLLDLVLFFLGRPHRLHAVQVRPAADRDYDLLAAALLETPTGVAHVEALAHPLNGIGAWRDGWDERIEITGVEGRLEVISAAWDHPETLASYLVHYDNRTRQATEYRFAPVSPFERALAFFCGNIARGEQGGQSRLTGYEVDEIIEHMMRSAAEGKALDVAWRDAPAG